MPAERKACAPETRKARDEVEIRHLADRRRLDALARAADIDGPGREVLRPVRARQDQRAAAIGDQAAHEQPEGIGDHAARQHVVDGDRVVKARARVERRPFALDDGDHGQLLLGQPGLLHHAQHRDREAGRRGRDAIGQLELAEELQREDGRVLADVVPPALAMRDEDCRAEPRGDRRDGVPDMDDERAAADRGAVDVSGRDAEIMRDLGRVVPCRRHAVDLLRRQPAIGHGVQRRIGMELQLRDVRQLAQPGRLGRADDGNLARDGVHHAPSRELWRAGIAAGRSRPSASRR